MYEIPTRMINTAHLVSQGDIAQDMGVPPYIVKNWRVRYKTFPEPVAVVSKNSVTLYDREEVRAWHRKTIR